MINVTGSTLAKKRMMYQETKHDSSNLAHLKALTPRNKSNFRGSLMDMFQRKSIKNKTRQSQLNCEIFNLRMKLLNNQKIGLNNLKKEMNWRKINFLLKENKSNNELQDTLITRLKEESVLSLKALKNYLRENHAMKNNNEYWPMS